MSTQRTRIAAAALLLGSLALVAGCGGSSAGDDAAGTTTTADAVDATTAPSPTTTAASEGSTTTTGGEGSTTTGPPNTLPVLVPGEPCTPGSDPDCIDPYGDGEYVYLLGGADCMASAIGGPACADLDQDGYAGYPDRG